MTVYMLYQSFVRCPCLYVLPPLPPPHSAPGGGGGEQRPGTQAVLTRTGNKRSPPLHACFKDKKTIIFSAQKEGLLSSTYFTHSEIILTRFCSLFVLRQSLV
jgi:hypothetical protein